MSFFSFVTFLNATTAVNYAVCLVSRNKFQILRAEVKMAQNQRHFHQDGLLVPTDIKN